MSEGEYAFNHHLIASGDLTKSSRQYEELSVELSQIPKSDPSQQHRRRRLRERRNGVVEMLERRGDQILRLYSLLHFEDRPV